MKNSTSFKPGHTFSRKYKAEYADSLVEYFLTSEKFPTYEEWAIQNHIDVRTVYNWKDDPEKFPNFQSACAQAKAIQKTKLIQCGLTEQYNAQLVKFLLTNNHGMSEKSAVDNTVRFEVQLSDEIDGECD